MKSENSEVLRTPDRQRKFRTGLAGAALTVTALAGGAVLATSGSAHAESPAPAATTDTPSPSPTPDLGQLNPNTNPNITPDTRTPPASSPTPDLGQLNPNTNPNIHPDTVEPPVTRNIHKSEPRLTPHVPTATHAAAPHTVATAEPLPIMDTMVPADANPIIVPPHEVHDDSLDTGLTVGGATLLGIGALAAGEEFIRRRRQE